MFTIYCDRSYCQWSMPHMVTGTLDFLGIVVIKTAIGIYFRPPMEPQQESAWKCNSQCQKSIIKEGFFLIKKWV